MSALTESQLAMLEQMFPRYVCMCVDVCVCVLGLCPKDFLPVP